MGQIIEVLWHPSCHKVYSTLHNLRCHIATVHKNLCMQLYSKQFYMRNAPLFETMFYKFKKRAVNCKWQWVTSQLVWILARPLLSASGVVDEPMCYKFNVPQLRSRLTTSEHPFKFERCWLGQSEHTEGDVHNKIIKRRYSCWSS